MFVFPPCRHQPWWWSGSPGPGGPGRGRRCAGSFGACVPPSPHCVVRSAVGRSACLTHHNSEQAPGSDAVPRCSVSVRGGEVVALAAAREGEGWFHVLALGSHLAARVGHRARAAAASSPRFVFTLPVQGVGLGAHSAQLSSCGWRGGTAPAGGKPIGHVGSWFSLVPGPSSGTCAMASSDRTGRGRRDALQLEHWQARCTARRRP